MYSVIDPEQTPSREFLLRASYLEIYNEGVHDLLAPISSGIGPTITDAGVVNLREEVVTSLKGIREVIERGDRNRRTAATDWNERSSRSHSVFRLVCYLDLCLVVGRDTEAECSQVIESREVSTEEDDGGDALTTAHGGRVTPGGTRLRVRGGRSVRSSVLVRVNMLQSASGSYGRTTEPYRSSWFRKSHE